MTVMEHCFQPITGSAGTVGEMLRDRMKAIARHQMNRFDTFAAGGADQFVAAPQKRRYTLQELLGDATTEGIERLNQATSWVQNDPSVGNEF